MSIPHNHPTKVWLGSLFAIILLLPGAGCIRFGESNNTSQSVAFETLDGGQTWEPIDTVWSATEPLALRSQKPRTAIIHPNDPYSLYVSLEGSGLYNYYKNAWLRLPGDRAPRAMVVDNERPCTLYASFDLTMEKSNDCGRNWVTLFQNAPNTTITALAISPTNPARILMGSNQGDIFLSTNYGQVWTSPLRAEAMISSILINPKLSDEIYIFTESNQLYRSSDAGINWTDLSSGLADFGSSWRSATLSNTTNGTLFVATADQLLQSDDRGAHWTALPLLTSIETTDIRSFVIDPQEGRGMYYASTNTFYRSADAGQHWQALPLPSSQSAYTILIDPQKHGHLYLIVAIK